MANSALSQYRPTSSSNDYQDFYMRVKELAQDKNWDTKKKNKMLGDRAAFEKECTLVSDRHFLFIFLQHERKRNQAEGFEEAFILYLVEEHREGQEIKAKQAWLKHQKDQQEIENAYQMSQNPIRTQNNYSMRLNESQSVRTLD